MCGILAVHGEKLPNIEDALKKIEHRGPDAKGSKSFAQCVLGHTRLKIIDLSEEGNQPMGDPSGRFWVVFNGELYNYVELRNELANHYTFRTTSDTEVLLYAYMHWKEKCLDKCIGMFSFVIWDEQEKVLFAARDRFGVKPCFYAFHEQGVYIASEIKSLHALGIPRTPDEKTWSSFLTLGLIDHDERTFWRGIKKLPAGHFMKVGKERKEIQKWYDLGQTSPCAQLSKEACKSAYEQLLEQTIRLRFRSDVPVGVNVSGGLDSSLLIGLIDKYIQTPLHAFTFATGDERYDETPWAKALLQSTKHKHHVVMITPEEIPELAEQVQAIQDEPYSGIPTLAYAKVFAEASKKNIKVVLDGQGMDEQWAGYDYYGKEQTFQGSLQGSSSSPVRPECVQSALKIQARSPEIQQPFPDALRNRQYKDVKYTKLPRALRFNDRISMMHSVELREPFLDHRLFEFAFHQPKEMKIIEGKHKVILREIAQALLPKEIHEAPKRPLQTPQREWLRGSLKPWATAQIKKAVRTGWFKEAEVEKEWDAYLKGDSDNSFYVWQWINVGLML